MTKKGTPHLRVEELGHADIVGEAFATARLDLRQQRSGMCVVERNEGGKKNKKTIKQPKKNSPHHELARKMRRGRRLERPQLDALVERIAGDDSCARRKY